MGLGHLTSHDQILTTIKAQTNDVSAEKRCARVLVIRMCNWAVNPSPIETMKSFSTSAVLENPVLVYVLYHAIFSSREPVKTGILSEAETPSTVAKFIALGSWGKWLLFLPVVCGKLPLVSAHHIRAWRPSEFFIREEETLRMELFYVEEEFSRYKCSIASPDVVSRVSDIGIDTQFTCRTSDYSHLRLQSECQPPRKASWKLEVLEVSLKGARGSDLEGFRTKVGDRLLSH